MLDECGVQLMDKVIRLGGHSAPRTMVPKAASGGGIVVPIHNWLKKNGVQFRNRSQVIDLLMQDGKVTGVLINCDYNWKDGTSKKEQRIGSRGGVVATGGWGQDKDFIKTTMPVYSLLECTSQPGATAEMLKALLKSGCLPSMLDMYQLGPWASPDEKGAGPGSFFADYAFAEGMAVNPKTGRRFMNELADRRTRADAELNVLSESTPDKINYPVVFWVKRLQNTRKASKLPIETKPSSVTKHWLILLKPTTSRSKPCSSRSMNTTRSLPEPRKIRLPSLLM